MNVEHRVRDLVRSAVVEAAKASGRGRRIRRYYHASPKRFKSGQILTGGHEGGYWSERGDEPSPNLCLTTSPVPHATIFTKAIEDNWFVYEVEPLQDIDDQHPNGNDEVQCHSARVIKLVGSARGLSRDRKSGSVVVKRGMVHDMLGWRRGKT
jgi:hypothetical protein